ncbi:MAG: MCP four helix bundle domain-containing protein [Pusillimonas sp.]|nr:MCP four helix bundle domain-containing protein [Pusillimonas sp.]
MKGLRNLKVRTKLIGSFLIVAAIAAIIGVIGMRSTQQINQLTQKLYEKEFIGLRHASEADRQLVAAGRALRSTLLTSTADDYRSEYFSIDNHFMSARLALEDLAKTEVSEQGRKRVQDAQEAVLAYMKIARDVVSDDPSVSLGRLDTIERVFTEMRPMGEEAESLIKRIVYDQQDDAKAATRSIQTIFQQTLIFMIVLTAIGVLIAIALGLLITRGLTRQLGGEPNEVASIAGSIAKGNLNNTIKVPKRANGSIMHAMHLMQESLRKVVGAVRTSSDHIAAGTTQIAAGNADLSQRTEEQAANLTETAAAMEELASTVKSNAEVAQQAAHMATSASKSATQGGEIVQNVVVTMQDINTSSRQIVDIISVIDSIAFQTNILALNAAVEAARAGEQGRGFAVVASEVRGLAQKSASAAKDIKNLIDNSVKKVDAGSHLVDEAGTAMQDIVNQVKRVTDLINEISAATTEQTSGINQINDAILQLSDVTQQNAALVQQSATASDSLKSQANRLVEVVNLFDIGQEYIDVQAREITRESEHHSQQSTASAAAQLPSGRKKKSPPPEIPHHETEQQEGNHDRNHPQPQDETAAKKDGITTTQNSGRELRRPDLGQSNESQNRRPHPQKEDDWEEF